MKGLIWKDLHVVWKKQHLFSWLFTFMMYVFVLFTIKNENGLCTIVLIAIPCGCSGFAVNMIEMDEKCDADRYIISMPFTKKEIVRARFYSGFCLSLLNLIPALLFILLYQVMYHLFSMESLLIITIWCLILSWLFLICSLVSAYVLGVNGSALTMLALICIAITIWGLLLYTGNDAIWLFQQSPWVMLGFGGILTVIITYLCYHISYHFYLRHHR